MRIIFVFLVLSVSLSAIHAQDEVIYREHVHGFYQDSIKPSIMQYRHSQEEKKADRYLSLDLTELQYPSKISDYKTIWHNPPLSQGNTGTCWCFATTSFLESEIFRITGNKIKLSEMYVVYWEYIARAKYFVEHRGDMYFGEGSEANAVTRIIKEHGLVPEGQYIGKQKGLPFHDHTELEKEIATYLEFIKEKNIWDKAAVISNVKSILDQHLGVPPEEVSLKDEKISTQDYMKDICGINPDDYFCFMSTRSSAYDQKAELEVPDNWWHSDDYYNIHLSDFSDLVITALEAGYTISICGDVSEPGYDRFAEAGIIPSFDIPRDLIDENSREFRLYNGTTTDDHCIHIVGYTLFDGDHWYLIKDSGAGGFDGPNKGYRFVREDYVKLKFIALMMHKDAARKVLDRIIK